MGHGLVSESMRAGMPADQDEAPLGAPAPSPAGFHKMQSGETLHTSASVDRLGVTRLVMGRGGHSDAGRDARGPG